MNRKRKKGDSRFNNISLHTKTQSNNGSILHYSNKRLYTANLICVLKTMYDWCQVKCFTQVDGSQFSMLHFNSPATEWGHFTLNTKIKPAAMKTETNDLFFLLSPLSLVHSCLHLLTIPASCISVNVALNLIQLNKAEFN